MTRTYAFHVFGEGGESRGQVTAPFASDEHAHAAARRLVAEHGLHMVHVSREGLLLFAVSDEESAA